MNPSVMGVSVSPYVLTSAAPTVRAIRQDGTISYNALYIASLTDQINNPPFRVRIALRVAAQRRKLLDWWLEYQINTGPLAKFFALRSSCKRIYLQKFWASITLFPGNVQPESK